MSSHVVSGGKAGCAPNEGTGRVVDTKLYSLGLFLLEAQIDNINQFTLIEFAGRSKLSHKVSLALRLENVVSVLALFVIFKP